MLLRRVKGSVFLRVAQGRRGAATHPRPFPVLEDPLDPSCPQLEAGRRAAEEVIGTLDQLIKFALGGGGERGIAVHVKKNRKILPREKLKLLLDTDADFLELSLLAGLGMSYGDVPAAGSITGIGRINGTYCMVTCSDGTVKSGTYFPITVTKNLRGLSISATNLLPVVQIVDSAGGFLPQQAELFADKNMGGRAFYSQAVLSSAGVPQIAAVCGSCTAGGAYQPSMCEDVVIVSKLGTIFLGGPPLVKAALGEVISPEELGGGLLHSRTSGVTDYLAESEPEAFEAVRDVVATLGIDPPPPPPPQDVAWDLSLLDALSGLEVISRPQVYGIIGRLVDGSRFREFKHLYGNNLTTGYGFIDGKCVGILGSAGPLSYQDGLKGSHFLQICQQRRLPLVFLQNSGPEEAHQSAWLGAGQGDQHLILRGRAAMAATLACVTVPKIAINVGNCHGDDNYTMCGPSFSPNFLFSWPGTKVTQSLNPPPVPPSDASQPQEKAGKKKKSASVFNFPSDSAFYQAAWVLNDGVIVPSQTRQIVSQCLRICQQKEGISNSPKDFAVLRL